MMLWCMAISHVMQGHRFSDDVALCRAFTKKGAIKKFQRMYGYSNLVLEGCVSRVKMNRDGVAILTDY